MLLKKYKRVEQPSTLTSGDLELALYDFTLHVYLIQCLIFILIRISMMKS